MIDLYALTSPNVQKIYIMLEETKLPYKEHFVDVWKGEQYDPDFIKINPNSKIPAIVDHDGPAASPIRCSSQAQSCFISPRNQDNSCRRTRRKNTTSCNG